ncbi:MAG: GAF domain-containing SpoIIE family protein phosphatase [Planctomycetales bacterium]
MPQVQTDSWTFVTGLCQKFTDATGWPLTFTPTEESVAEELETRLRNSPDCCWLGEIDNGLGRIGFLHLGLPEYSKRDQSFVPVSELTVGLAELLSEYYTAQHKLEMRTEQVSTLARVGMNSGSVQTLGETLNSLLSAACQLTGYRSAGFYLYSPETHAVRLKATFRIDPARMPPTSHHLGQSRPDLEALSGEVVFLQRDGGVDDRWLPSDAASALCVGVKSSQANVGTLWLYDRRKREPVDREGQVLSSIAAQIASTLERVVLLKESATQQRLTEELKTASENHVIPDTLMQFEGYEVAARCESLYELGGDLCEIMPIDEKTTGFALGDASGHSIPAAMVMAYARGAIRSLPIGLKGHEVDPPVLMSRINEALYAITSSHQFMSLFFGVYHAKRRELAYCNAGHPNPLWIHDGEIIPLQSHGLLVGVTDDVEYDSSTLTMSPGDTLVLFSDGISETMSRSQQLFRSEGIISAVRSCEGESAEDILHSIWRRMEAHAGGGSEQDDRTLMVVKFR